eukprot:gene7515-662_t
MESISSGAAPAPRPAPSLDDPPPQEQNRFFVPMDDNDGGGRDPMVWDPPNRQPARGGGRTPPRARGSDEQPSWAQRDGGNRGGAANVRAPAARSGSVPRAGGGPAKVEPARRANYDKPWKKGIKEKEPPPDEGGKKPWKKGTKEKDPPPDEGGKKLQPCSDDYDGGDGDEDADNDFGKPWKKGIKEKEPPPDLDGEKVGPCSDGVKKVGPCSDEDGDDRGDEDADNDYDKPWKKGVKEKDPPPDDSGKKVRPCGDDEDGGDGDEDADNDFGKPWKKGIKEKEPPPDEGGKKVGPCRDDEDDGDGGDEDADNDYDKLERRTLRIDHDSCTADKEGKKKEYVGPDADLAAQLERDMMDSSPDIHWTDIAGLLEAKRVLEEAAVLPLIMPEYFTEAKPVLEEGAVHPLIMAEHFTGIRRPFKPVLEEVAVHPLIMPEYLTGIRRPFKVRCLFDLARLHAPSIIFIDEVDSLCAQRGGDGEHEASRRVKTELLTQVDGCHVVEPAAEGELPKRVMVLAATNFPWEIDEAMRRCVVDMGEDCEELLKINLKLNDIASKLQGYSGDDITNICRDAALNGMRRGIAGKTPAELMKMKELGQVNRGQVNLGQDLAKDPIKMDDFVQAIKRINPSVSPADIKRHVDWEKDFGST